MKVTFNTSIDKKTSALVIFVTEKNVLGTFGASTDKKTSGALSKALKMNKKACQKNALTVLTAVAGVSVDHVVLVGLGKSEEITDLDLEALGGNIQKRLNGLKVSKASVMIEDIKSKNYKKAQIADSLALGATLGSYRYDTYKTSETKDKKPSLKSLEIILKDAEGAKILFKRSDKIAQGAFWTRDLVTMPGNDLYPESFANDIKKTLTKLGVKVQIMTAKQIKKAGMGALTSVGQGSANEEKLVIMKYNGLPSSASKKDQKPIAFVGKGITFDTGGISLKPGAGMWDMKFDMGGAGVVVGLMKALAARKAKVNIVAVVALAENMPSSKATRPGDIVTSLSGKTIEVLNTDAEGRMVLADALWHVQEKFEPRFVIDLATLTGAMIMALGHEYGGVYSNDDTLPKQIVAAGEKVGEPAWHMPICDAWEKSVVSEVADLKNITAPTVGAGSATAACFLKNFIKPETPWAHIDIAGVAWVTTPKPTTPKGATAWGVRLLDRLVADNYEK